MTQDTFANIAARARHHLALLAPGQELNTVQLVDQLEPVDDVRGAEAILAKADTRKYVATALLNMANKGQFPDCHKKGPALKRKCYGKTAYPSIWYKPDTTLTPAAQCCPTCKRPL